MDVVVGGWGDGGGGGRGEWGAGNPWPFKAESETGQKKKTDQFLKS